MPRPHNCPMCTVLTENLKFLGSLLRRTVKKLYEYSFKTFTKGTKIKARLHPRQTTLPSSFSFYKNRATQVAGEGSVVGVVAREPLSVPLNLGSWGFLTIRFESGTFGRKITEAVLCSSCCPLSGDT